MLQYTGATLWTENVPEECWATPSGDVLCGKRSSKVPTIPSDDVLHEKHSRRTQHKILRWIFAAITF